jgi:Tol biopolymer transport system component
MSPDRPAATDGAESRPVRVSRQASRLRSAAMLGLATFAVLVPGGSAGLRASGGEILFNSWANGAPARWYVVKPDGAGLRQVLINVDLARMSPDGSKLAFGCAERLLCVSNADGSGRRVLASPTNGDLFGSAGIDWSPDSRRVAFSSGQGLWTVMADGSHLRLIVRLSKMTASVIRWSPRGRWIAFVRNLSGIGPGRQEIPGSLWVAKANGSHLHRLARIGYEATPSWSPNERAITYSTALIKQFGPLVQVVYNVDLTSGRIKHLKRGSDPVYSPDGHTIVFDRLVEPYLFVIRMDADGAHERRLARGFAPAWSPDGHNLAYASEKLMVMARNGSRKRVVAPATDGDIARIAPLQWAHG